MPKADPIHTMRAPLRNACLAAGLAALCSGPAFGRLLITATGPYTDLDAPEATCAAWTRETDRPVHPVADTAAARVAEMRAWALGFLEASAIVNGMQPPTAAQMEREISAVCSRAPRAVFQGVVQTIAAHPPREWLRRG